MSIKIIFKYNYKSRPFYRIKYFFVYNYRVETHLPIFVYEFIWTKKTWIQKMSHIYLERVEINIQLVIQGKPKYNKTEKKREEIKIRILFFCYYSLSFSPLNNLQSKNKSFKTIFFK